MSGLAIGIAVGAGTLLALFGVSRLRSSAQASTKKSADVAKDGKRKHGGARRDESSAL